MRLAAIVVIAAVSALVLTALLLGAHELTFLIQRMTEGGYPPHQRLHPRKSNQPRFRKGGGGAPRGVLKRCAQT
jgi:hypothetical protein